MKSTFKKDGRDLTITLHKVNSVSIVETIGPNIHTRKQFRHGETAMVNFFAALRGAMRCGWTIQPGSTRLPERRDA